MNKMPTTEDLKRSAAQAAVLEVTQGMLVGLGTGSTAAYALDALAFRAKEGLRFRAVATSERTACLAKNAGIEVLDMADFADVDLCIDGVDEVDPSFRAIKGAGGAMLREKIVATAAKRMIAIADASKAVERLGSRPVPVEVLPFARAFVAREISQMGGEPLVRRERDGAMVRTDQENVILDCRFADLSDLFGVAENLASLPGVLAHGLFLKEISALYLGTPQGVLRTERFPLATDEIPAQQL